MELGLPTGVVRSQSTCRHFRTYRRLELRNGIDTAVHFSGKTFRSSGKLRRFAQRLCCILRCLNVNDQRIRVSIHRGLQPRLKEDLWIKCDARPFFSPIFVRSFRCSSPNSEKRILSLPTLPSGMPECTCRNWCNFEHSPNRQPYRLPAGKKFRAQTPPKHERLPVPRRLEHSECKECFNSPAQTDLKEK
jgi:hypothetical protein